MDQRASTTTRHHLHAILSLTLGLTGIGVVATSLSYAPLGIGTSVLTGSALFFSAVIIALRRAYRGVSLVVGIAIAAVTSYLFPYRAWSSLALPVAYILHGQPLHDGRLWGVHFSMDFVLLRKGKAENRIPENADMHYREGYAYFFTNPAKGVYYGIASCPGLVNGSGRWKLQPDSPVSAGFASFSALYDDLFQFYLVVP